MEPTDNNQKGKFIYALSLGLELGFFIALPLVFFLLFGLFLDKILNTFPIFLILFIILSFGATFLNIRYLIMPFLEKRSGKNKQ